MYVQLPLPEIAAMITDNVWVLALGENGDLLLNDIEVFACMRKEAYQIKPGLKDHQRLTSETPTCETYLASQNWFI